jgi:hypothetical protein
LEAHLLIVLDVPFLWKPSHMFDRRPVNSCSPFPDPKFVGIETMNGELVVLHLVLKRIANRKGFWWGFIGRVIGSNCGTGLR